MKTALPLIPLLEPIRPQMKQVDGVLHQLLARAEEPLRSMLGRSLGGGKRLRPALVILIGQVFDVPLEPFHRLAAAVDMLHAATLVHDDLVDESPLRRGRETLHTTWSVGATVLAGDYLLGESTALVAELGHPRVLEIFACILRTMCAGEIEHLLSTKQTPESREEYYRRIEAKTASMFAATTEMAAVLAGAEEPQIAALGCFGREIGMAFQIVDDVLDFIGDEARLGKPAGSDLRQGLVTLPVLHYLEQGKDLTPINAVLSGRQDRREKDVQVAIEAVVASGAIESALTEARAYARRGQEALTLLPDNTPRRMLHELAKYMVERRS